MRRAKAFFLFLLNSIILYYNIIQYYTLIWNYKEIYYYKQSFKDMLLIAYNYALMITYYIKNKRDCFYQSRLLFLI